MVNFVLIMKKVTIVGTNISPKQWSNLILELNLIRKQWNPYAKFEFRDWGQENHQTWHKCVQRQVVCRAIREILG